MLNKNFFYSVSMLVGTIIGVGIFAIPYVTSKAGFVIGFIWLIILGAATILVHLLYGEIILRTEGKHRLVGYAEIYCGKIAKFIVAASVIFGFYGALLVYFLIGGQFLFILLEKFFGGSPFSYSLVLFFISAIFTYKGLKAVALAELLMTVLMVFIVFVLIAGGMPKVNFPNFSYLDLSNFFLPYGVILFSYGGFNIIPEVRRFLKGKEAKLKEVLIWGTLLPIIIYILFTFIVVGITGATTTPESLSGLKEVLGDGIVALGAVFGLLAIITSLFALGLNLKETFYFDYHIPHFISWISVVFVPLVLFVSGVTDFITIISLVGAVTGGIGGAMIAFIYFSAKKHGNRRPEYSLNISPLLIMLVPLIFILGIIYEVFYFLK